MEGGVAGVSADIRRRAREALEAAGIEFLDHKRRPGVRLRARGEP
jgi:hypothetical protein